MACPAELRQERRRVAVNENKMFDEDRVMEFTCEGNMAKGEEGKR